MADEPGNDDAAWAPPAAAPAAVRALVPGYRDFVPLARGGDSVVYRAHQDAVDRDVAIKVVQLDDPESIARFRRELEITVRLGRQHPHIMTVLAIGSTVDGQPCLVMDFFELGSLHDRLSERGPLPVSEVVTAGSVIADALAFAHGQGVLHRDVKPQNVLVLPTSHVLADFGLARAIDAGHSSSLERFSYRHASPQILDGESPTVADDIYSLGSTLFTLLDGRPPFAAADPDEDSALSYLRRARTEQPRHLERDDLPAGLGDVVMRCLARRREDRYAEAGALRDALGEVPTETRSWAPDEQPARPGTEPAIPPPDPPPIESGPRHARPDTPTLDAAHADVTTPRPAGLLETAAAPDAAPAEPASAGRTGPAQSREPEHVAVSALAHLGAATVSRDTESTGVRPSEPVPPPPEPPESGRPRWVPVAALVAVALVAGIAIGVFRGSGGDSPAPSPSPSQSRDTADGGVIDGARGSGVPSTTVTDPNFDPALGPVIKSVKRTGSGIDVRWTDPGGGKYPVLIYFDQQRPEQRDPGVTSVSFENVSPGTHRVCVQTVHTVDGGDPVFGYDPDKSCRDA